MIANDATETPTGTSSLHLAARTACLPGQARATPGTLGAETPAEVVTEAEQMPRRARYLVPRGLPRRDEVLAVCVVAVVLAHLLFAQLTIVLAAVLYLITRVTRWRLSWLTVPAAIASGRRAAAPRPRARSRNACRQTSGGCRPTPRLSPSAIGLASRRDRRSRQTPAVAQLPHASYRP